MGDRKHKTVEANSRREPRFAINDLAEVTVLNVPGSPCVEGRLHDLSRSGLALATDTLIAEGSTVKVDLSETTIYGIVRYCHVTRGGFRVGLEIDTVRFLDGTPVTELTLDSGQGSLWSQLKRLYRGVTTGT